MAKFNFQDSPASKMKESLNPGENIVTFAPTSLDIEKQQTHEQLKEDNPDLNPDFKTIKLVSSIVIFILRKGWMISSTCVFLTFMAYWCYGSVLALLLFITGLAGLFYQISDWLLYHPDKPPHSRLYVPMPSLIGLPADNFFLTTEDKVKIQAVFIKQDATSIGQVPTILFLHGNAGNIGHRLPLMRGFYTICGCNILMLEYRGYGRSFGTPSEEGLYLDAQAGLNFLLQVPFIDKSRIIVYGRSLGGAVAIDLVSRPEFAKNVFALIVENSFTSIPEIAVELFGFAILRWIPVWAYKNKFSSAEKIARVKRPTLLISGESDALVPPQMMKKLLELCGSEIKRLQLFSMGTHNDTWRCPGYYSTIDMFLDDVVLLMDAKGSCGEECHVSNPRQS